MTSKKSVEEFANKENADGGWEEFQSEVYLQTVKVVENYLSPQGCVLVSFSFLLVFF